MPDLSPRRLDVILAVAGIAGAWWNATTEPHQDFDALAVLALAVLMGSIAWRRANPIATTIAATSALMVFQAVSHYNGDGTFEAAAIAFNFYLLGQRSRLRPHIMWCVVCFALWMACAVVITYDSGKGSLGEVAGTWAIFGPLPFICGFLLASRTELTAELEKRSAELDVEHELRSRSAATKERGRMARRAARRDRPLRERHGRADRRRGELLQPPIPGPLGMRSGPWSVPGARR